MIVVAAQKSHCVELTGIMGLRCDKQLTSHIMDAITHGCGAAAIDLAHHQRDCRGSGVRHCNKWPQSVPVGVKKKQKQKMHRDSSTCAALTGFSPLATSLYSGHSARLSPLGFLALLIYTSLQATFTVRTVQLYFQAH